MDGYLKIGLASPYDQSFFGGVASHIGNLATHLTKIGHEVRVIAPSSYSEEQYGKNFLSVGGSFPVPSAGTIARISLSMSSRRKIREILDKENFDIVHIHEPFAGLLGANILTLVNPKSTAVVATFHTFGGTYLYRLGFKHLAKPFFKKLDGRIAVSSSAEQFISRRFPGCYEIIPNGVEISEFCDAEPFEHLQDGRINLLFLGRLEKRKGLRYLLQAYAQLSKEIPDIRLLVVGAGSVDLESAQLIGERGLRNIEFIGPVSDKDRARFFKSAHVYCAPAIGNESFGIVLLEAMASGTPIVASGIAGYSNVIDDEQDGLMVSPKDPNAMCNAIKRIIVDAELANKLSLAGKAKAELYRWEKVAIQVANYYRDVLSNSSATYS